MTVANFTELYHRIVDDRPILALFLPGHLAIEFLLGKLALQSDPSLSSFVNKATHAKLIAKCGEIGAISPGQVSVLTLINRTRNKFAHEIGYQPSINELRQLWEAAAAAFTDMTDGISQGLNELAEKQSARELEDWVFSELFVQICYDLHNAFMDGGGDVEDF